MLKKIAVALGTMAVVTLLGLYAVGTVFAQGPTATPDASQPKAAQPKADAWGRICRGAGVISDSVTKLLGMTPQQIMAERAAGKTLSQIAKEKNVTDQQVIDAIVAGEQSAVDQAVKDGKITQAQADWLVARAKAMAPFALSNPFTPKAGQQGMGMRGDHAGHGRWNGQKGTTGKPAATPSPTASQS